MYYVIMGLAVGALFALFQIEKRFNEKQYKQIIELEQKIWRNEIQKDKMRKLADEQNWGLENFKAGREEIAFEYFQNVKDEIETLANKEELNTTTDNENV